MDNTTSPNLHSPKIKWAYTCLIVFIIWFALVLQFAISISAYQQKGYSLTGALIQILSFYTILSNLLVVISLTVLLLASQTAWGKFFAKGSVLTAIAVHITIVGIVYALLLKGLANLQGWPKLADDLLHTVNPILFIIYWLAYAPKQDLKYRQVFPWLWYPFIYLIYTLIRGALTTHYPYPFMNVTEFGYEQVLFNSVVLLVVYLGFGALYILMGRLISKTQKAVASS